MQTTQKKTKYRIRHPHLLPVIGIFIGIFSIWFSVILLKGRDDFHDLEKEYIINRQNAIKLKMYKKQLLEREVSLSGNTTTGSNNGE